MVSPCLLESCQHHLLATAVLCHAYGDIVAEDATILHDTRCRMVAMLPLFEFLPEAAEKGNVLIGRVQHMFARRGSSIAQVLTKKALSNAARCVLLRASL
jgi:hypothetical protein